MARLDINLSKMAVMLIPPFLRGGMLQSIMTSAVAALDSIHNGLYQFHMENLYGTRYRIAHNSQTCRLRGVLNDMFDADLRRIEIDKGAEHEMLYVYYDRELVNGLDYLRTYLPATLYTYHETTAESDMDFTVVAPKDLEGRDLAMRATIDKYKLVGKTYQILYV